MYEYKDPEYPDGLEQLDEGAVDALKKTLATTIMSLMATGAFAQPLEFKQPNGEIVKVTVSKDMKKPEVSYANPAQKRAMEARMPQVQKHREEALKK